MTYFLLTPIPMYHSPLPGYDEQSFYAVPGTGTSNTKYDDDSAQSWSVTTTRLHSFYRLTHHSNTAESTLFIRLYISYKHIL